MLQSKGADPEFGVHFVEKVEDQKKKGEAQWVKEASLSPMKLKYIIIIPIYI